MVSEVSGVVGDAAQSDAGAESDSSKSSGSSSSSQSRRTSKTTATTRTRASENVGSRKKVMKGASKPGGKAAAKAKSRKGKRQCQGCFKWFDVNAFAAGSIFCPADKKGRDNLYNQAKRQDQLEWFNSQMAIVDKRKKLLSKYHELCPRRETGKRPPMPDILTFKELFESSSEMHRGSEGKMMSMREYLHFKMKPKNGGWSADKAKRRFEKLIKDEDSIVDADNEDSDDPDNKDRLWVKTADKIDFKNVHKRAKQMELADKTIKKVDSAQLDKAFKRLNENHETNLPASASSMQELARTMSRSATFAQNAFANQNMELGKVRDLVPASEEEEEESEEEEEKKKKDRKEKKEKKEKDESAGAASDSDASVATRRTFKKDRKDKKDKKEKKEKDKKEKKHKKDPEKKDPWFDKDDFISKQVRTMVDWVDSTRRMFTEVIQTYTDSISEASSRCVLGHVANEEAIATNRIAACRLVVGSVAADSSGSAHLGSLASLIAHYKDPTRGAASTGDRQPRSRLGNAPPCRSFEDLKTLTWFEEQAQLFHNYDSKSEMVDFAKTFKPSKDAVNELKNNTRSFLVKFKQVITNAIKIHGVDSSKERTPKKADAGLELFCDACVKCMRTLRPMALPYVVKVATEHEPVIIKLCSNRTEFFEADGALVKDVDLFETKFEKARKQKGADATAAAQGKKLSTKETLKAVHTAERSVRLSRQVAQTAADQFLVTLESQEKGFQLQSTQSDLWDPDIIEQNESQIFGVAKRYEGAFIEKGGLACLRFTVAGTRTVVMADAADFARWCQRKEKGKPAMSPKEAKSAFMNMDVAAVKAYGQDHRIFAAEVGPGEALWTPPSMLVAHVRLQIPIIFNQTVSMQCEELCFRLDKTSFLSIGEERLISSRMISSRALDFEQNDFEQNA